MLPFGNPAAEGAAELAEQIARLSASGLPLAAGLRAAADESIDGRLADSLRRMADELEQGQTLDEVVRTAASRLPRPFPGFAAAALRTGKVGPAFLELVDLMRRQQALRQEVWRGLAYPLVVGCLAAAIFVFVLWLIGSWRTLFEEFAIQVPLVTRLVFWWRDVGIWVLGGALAGLFGLAWLLRRFLGPAAWLELVSSLPLVGALPHGLGMAEWAGMMAILARYGIPLPESLQLSAEGVGNDHVARLARGWAAEAGQGAALSALLSHSRAFPRGVTPVVRWGEANGQLDAALAVVCESLERSVQLRAGILHAVLPPLLFLAIGCVVLMVVIGLCAPLVGLIGYLSS